MQNTKRACKVKKLLPFYLVDEKKLHYPVMVDYCSVTRLENNPDIDGVCIQIWVLYIIKTALYDGIV